MKLERWGDWAADYAGATVVEPFTDVANFVITDSAHVAESWDTGYSPEFGEAAKLGLLGDDTDIDELSRRGVAIVVRTGSDGAWSVPVRVHRARPKQLPEGAKWLLCPLTVESGRVLVHCACYVIEAGEEHSVGVPRGRYSVRVCRLDYDAADAPTFVVDLWPATEQDEAEYRWEWLD